MVPPPLSTFLVAMLQYNYKCRPIDQYRNDINFSATIQDRWLKVLLDYFLHLSKFVFLWSSGHSTKDMFKVMMILFIYFPSINPIHVCPYIFRMILKSLAVIGRDRLSFL